ncbi:MAG: YgfZ/GcvT domain-containing protein [Terriglobales bacterium]
MLTTPLEQHHSRQGLALAPYRGSLTLAGGPEALVFEPWPQEQLLLYDASWRAVSAVTGPDARKWLNGMISANVRDLPPGQFTPSFQLDPKGHVLATLEIACTGPDAFLLLSDEEQRAGLEQRLRGFIFISKLQMEDRSQAWSSLRLRGPRAAEVAAQAGWCATALTAGAVRSLPEAGWTLASAAGGIPQLECVAPVADVVALWHRLEGQATVAGSGAQEQDRIVSRQPLYGVDITAAELPQETGQLDRLSFTKGCYIGQEIVERIRARGAVHRHWGAFRLDAPVAAGDAIEHDGRDVGALTSVAAERGQWLGLGYAREVETGQEVRVAGVRGERIA